MLDTNMLGALIDPKRPRAAETMLRHSRSTICLSVVSEAEVHFGLAKNPADGRKAALMMGILANFSILPWTSATAATYGRVRAQMQRSGLSLAPLDLLIAAHALEVGAILITSDRAFRHVPGLTVEDWTV